MKVYFKVKCYKAILEIFCFYFSTVGYLPSVTQKKYFTCFTCVF